MRSQSTFSRTSRVLSLVFALGLVAAACGSDSDNGDTDTDGTTTTTAAGEETNGDTGTEGGGDDEGAAGDACAIENLPLHSEGQLTIATGEPAYDPWVLNDAPESGEGFEAAVAYALATEMGFAEGDVVWVRTGFDEAIAPGSKNYDFNMQQYSITEERDEIVDFSIPYYKPQKSVLALNSSPAATATTFTELAEARWGATTGTTDLDYIENELGIDDVAVYDTQADVVAAMKAGHIDATVVGLPTALYLNAVELDDSVISGVLPDSDTDGAGMGLLFTEGSELLECVNASLQVLTDNGTLDQLATTWLRSGGDIAEISAD